MRGVDHGMTAEEFEAMHAYPTSYPLWVQSLDRRLGYQLDSEFLRNGLLHRRDRKAARGHDRR
jgi:hypothetical protein